MTNNASDTTDIPLHVVNRGWNRYGVHEAPFGSEREMPWLTAHMLQRAETLPTPRSDLPWAHLQWWESEWQAAKGIEALCSRPFLYLMDQMQDEPTLIPTRILYPYAFKSSETERIQESARFIAAMVRQAREFYTAAQSAGVTDLSRPVLYFYGAVALAKAAVAATFGRDHVERGHGLDHTGGPSARHETAPWPVIIGWQRSGEFTMLYRAARWDGDLYRATQDQMDRRLFQAGSQPKFHVLECIRWLGYDWGLLPATGFEKPPNYATGRTDRERCLLAYRGPRDAFMRRDTPLDSSLYQMPLVVVQYMLLYYFSNLARYNGLEWQALLAAATEPEGYVFRVALENVARDFIAELTHLLPRPQDNTLRKFSWHAEMPDLEKWYPQPVERNRKYVLPYSDLGHMEEWQGK